MIPICDWCEGSIDRNNHGHAGFCSPRCRDEHRTAIASNAVKRGRRQDDRPVLYLT